MFDDKTSDTPMATTTKLDNDEAWVDMDETKNRGMIGSLLYLTTSKPHVVFSVGMCSMFQPRHKESHLKVVKQFL